MPAMSTIKKDSRNLSARQRARLATEENQRKLKARQKALAKVFPRSMPATTPP